MSLHPNAFGVALGTSTPALSWSAVTLPFGQFLKPGARVAAYVRSTGAQDLDDLLIRDNLVASIDEGLKRCRAGQDDVVMVLPGHTETHSVSGDIWPNKVAGAKVVSCGRPGSTSNPTVTLSHVGASLAMDVADFGVFGLNISSATAALTGAIVVTAAGGQLVGNKIALTGALGANPGIAVTGAADFLMAGNHVVCDSTDPIVEVTGAGSTDLQILGNLLRQEQATNGGDYVSLANTAGISGFVGYNSGKTATPLTTPGTGFDLDAANVIANVLNIENYCTDNVATAGVIATGATHDPT